MSDRSTTMPDGGLPPELPPVVPDHEVLPRIIGRGSYGTIFLARNVMGTWRAVKAVYRSRFDSERPYEREWEAIRKFEPVSRSHPCQVHVLQIGRNAAAGYFYYVMELADDAAQGAGRPTPILDHESASRISDPASYVPRTLAHELRTRGRLPFEECLDISLLLANALEHLHKNGLVHRDIKPANIVFVSGTAKLADIGSVASVGAQTIVGTEGYLPEEVPGTRAADIFSLGKVMYEMMTGQHVADFPKLPAGFEEWVGHDRWLELNTVILQATAADLKKRYATAAQLHGDLVSVQAGQSPRWQRTKRRLKALRFALGGVAIAAFFAMAFLFEQGRINREARRGNLVRDAQMLRLGPRPDGWSDEALKSLQEAGKVRLDDELRGQTVAVLAEMDTRVIHVHPNTAASHLAFDADGKSLLMDGGGEGLAARWDLTGNRFTHLPGTNTGPIWLAADGTPRQFTLLANDALAILKLEDGQVLREFQLPAPNATGKLNVLALAISADATWCAAATKRDEQSQIAVWDAAMGRLVATLAQGCTALALSPTGDCLATGDGQGNVRLWSLPDLAEVASFQQERGAVLCFAFRRDLSLADQPPTSLPWLLAAGDNGGKIHIYQVARKRLKAICLGSPFQVDTVSLSPDGMTLASGGHREVRLWEVATGHLLAMVVWDGARALTFSPDGQRLAVSRHPVSSEDSPRVGVLELVTRRGVRALQGLSSQTAKLAFSPDGQRLAALAHNWEVGIWNLATHRMERTLAAPTGISADNAGLAFSRDGRQFAFATAQAACLWDLGTGRLLRTWPLPRGLQQWLCFDASGRLVHLQCDLPTRGNQGVCRIRDLLRVDYTNAVAELPRFAGEVVNGALSSNGRLAAVVYRTSNADGKKRQLGVYDTFTGKPLNLPLESIERDKISFEPAGTMFACWDGAANLTTVYSMPDGKELWRRVGMLEALGPNGEWSLSGGYVLSRGSDPRWSLDLSSAGSPRVALFSPDGRRLAVGNSEGTVFVYDLEETAQHLQELGLGW